MTEPAFGKPDLFTSIDRRTWKRYLFYGDMAVWTIFVVSLTLTMTNLYFVGWTRGEGAIDESYAYWWNVMVSLSFMVAAMAWLFFRFWKNGYLALRKPF